MWVMCPRDYEGFRGAREDGMVCVCVCREGGGVIPGENNGLRYVAFPMATKRGHCRLITKRRGGSGGAGIAQGAKSSRHEERGI